jgi:hypothetical protein
MFDGCPSSDQLLWRGKIPGLAGVSIFCGPMAKRKQSKDLLRNMTRLSGLLTMSTVRAWPGNTNDRPLQTTSACHILLTGKQPAWGHIGVCQNLPVIDPVSAVQFMTAARIW